MPLAEDLTKLRTMCQDLCLSLRDSHEALIGLESRYRDAMQRLDKPLTAKELQGLTEFLLSSTVTQRQFSERQILAFSTVAEALQPAIDFCSGIPDPNAG